MGHNVEVAETELPQAPQTWAGLSSMVARIKRRMPAMAMGQKKKRPPTVQKKPMTVKPAATQPLRPLYSRGADMPRLWGDAGKAQWRIREAPWEPRQRM